MSKQAEPFYHPHYIKVPRTQLAEDSISDEALDVEVEEEVYPTEEEFDYFEFTRKEEDELWIALFDEFEFELNIMIGDCEDEVIPRRLVPKAIAITRELLGEGTPPTAQPAVRRVLAALELALSRNVSVLFAW